MKLHLVGGFLGSGKTTAIIQAVKKLMADGKRVGVVTNDQGRYLVDTAFIRLADVPTVEVTGGCFCCKYDDLDKSIAGLIQTAAPDVIFAESVGSCADIVATVVKPLMQLNKSFSAPTSFSVFADSRLLRRRLRNDPMPFSEDIVYIFDKQIEEAGLWVVNKIDLLNDDQRKDLQERIQSKLSGKQIIYQASLTPPGVEKWLQLLEAGRGLLPEASLEIDYDRYGRGEAQLAWLDEAVVLRGVEASNSLRWIIIEMVRLLKEQNRAVGHLKFSAQTGEGTVKISFPTLEEDGWEQRLPMFEEQEIRLIVNARVEMPAQDLRELFKRCLSQCGVGYSEEGVNYFHPSQPDTTHRIP